MMIQKNAFIRKTGTGWQLTSTLLIVAALLVAGGCTRDPKAKAEKHFAQAQEYLRDDKSDEALIELRRALQLEPRMAKAHYEIAKINMAKGMAPAAHQALLQAVKFDPSHKDAQIMLADILVGFADPDTARDRAEFIAKTWPDDVRSQLLMAEIDMRTGATASARERLEKVLAATPDNTRALFDLAVVQLRDKQWEQAEANFRKAWSLRPESTAPMALLSQAFEARGDAERAERVLKEVLQQQPTSVAAKYVLATYYIRHQKLEAAEPLLKEIRDSLGNDPRGRGILAQFYLVAGRHEDAIQEYERITAANKEDRLNRLRLAEVYASLGRFGDARRVADELVKSDANDGNSLGLRGTILLDMGDVEAAALDLQAAQKLNPDSGPVYYNLARISLINGNPKQARSLLEEALRRSPRHNPSKVLLGTLALGAGDVDEAMRQAEAVVAQRPTYVEPYILLAQALSAKGKIGVAEQGLRLLLPAMQNPAARVKIINTLAKMKMQQKQYPAAIGLAKEALGLDANSADALSLVGAAYVVQGKVDQGLQEVAAHVQRHPTASAYSILGDVARSAARFDAAAEAYTKALTMDAKYRPAAMGLADSYAAMGKLSEALEIYRRESSRSPNDATAHLRQAQVYEASGDWKNAIASYESALKIDDNRIEALNNAAWLYAEHGGNLEMALTMAQRAKEFMPDDPRISDTLGWVYLKSGAFDSAVRTLRESVDKVPQNPTYRYHLGMAYYKAGRMAEAREQLQIALKAPGFKYGDDARKLLAMAK